MRSSDKPKHPDRLTLGALVSVIAILDRTQASLNKRGFYAAASKISDARITAREEFEAFGVK